MQKKENDLLLRRAALFVGLILAATLMPALATLAALTMAMILTPCYYEAIIIAVYVDALYRPEVVDFVPFWSVTLVVLVLLGTIELLRDRMRW